MPNNYLLRFSLTSFIGSRVMEVENDEGFMEKGIFIPFEINGLHTTNRGNVSAYCFVTERMTASIDGSSHYLKMKLSKAVLDRINELGYDTPFMGCMKPSHFTPTYQLDYLKSAQRVSATEYFKEKKELDYDEL